MGYAKKREKAMPRGMKKRKEKNHAKGHEIKKEREDKSPTNKWETSNPYSKK